MFCKTSRTPRAEQRYQTLIEIPRSVFMATRMIASLISTSLPEHACYEDGKIIENQIREHFYASAIAIIDEAASGSQFVSNHPGRHEYAFADIRLGLISLSAARR